MAVPVPLRHSNHKKITRWLSFWPFVIEGDGSHRWTQANRFAGLVEPFDTRPRHLNEPWPANPPQLRIYAGQVDPNDASH